MKNITPPKSVALTFRGIECSPEAVEELVGARASEKGIRGNPVRTGVKAILKRSFVRFSISLDSSGRLDQAIPALLEALGGIDNLINARNRTAPEFFEVDITWPIKRSENQEGGILSSSTLADLTQLKCNLSFSFL